MPIPQKRPMRGIKNHIEAIFLMEQVAEMGIQWPASPHHFLVRLE